MRNSLKSRGARNADRYGISATMRIVYAVLILLVIPAWNAAADPEADRIMREVERNERSSHSSMELVMTVYDDGRVSSGVSVRIRDREQEQRFIDLLEGWR